MYLSLPISGYDLDERKETALAMEVKLRGHGYDVFNPLGDQFQPGLTTNEYMKLDLKALLIATLSCLCMGGIVVLAVTQSYVLLRQ